MQNAAFSNLVQFFSVFLCVTVILAPDLERNQSEGKFSGLEICLLHAYVFKNLRLKQDCIRPGNLTEMIVSFLRRFRESIETVTINRFP